MASKKKDLSDFSPPITKKQYRKLQEDLRISNQKVAQLSATGRAYKIKPLKKKTYKCALTSDWHFGSLYCNVAALHEFYAYATKNGVKDFYCAGDMLDGDKTYRGQEYELRYNGFDRQLNAIVEFSNTLSSKIKTYFITGNHDATFTRQIGMSVGPQIQGACKNFVYIGADVGQVTIELPTADLRIALMHPDGGTAYALSYKSQKIIESWEGGDKPHVLGIGHFHKAEYMPRYRNVKAIQAGCFQDQTPFMRRRALAAHVGGWILEITMGELTNQIRTEFVEFF
jgi:hypothetical protein